jgi:hypothetical protein
LAKTFDTLVNPRAMSAIWIEPNPWYWPDRASLRASVSISESWSSVLLVIAIPPECRTETDGCACKTAANRADPI